MNRTMIENSTEKKSTVPTVMIVDDEVSIRETVADILNMGGLNCISASGCDQCITELQNGFSGVVLMDVMMPGKNGWETLREIRSLGLEKRVLFVMLTALDSPDEEMDGLQELVIDYITKPFDVASMLATVRGYLASLMQISETN